MIRSRLVVALSLLALGLAGCGSAGGEKSAGTAPRSDRLVNFSQKPPYVNALDIDPATGDFLLTTNKGFWTIQPKSGKVTRLTGKVSAGGASSTVGTFLELLSTGPGKLVGSGHPDTTSLPSFLGLMSSDDAGKSWKVLARLGEADLHKIVLRHGRLYAFDAVLGALLISSDQGRNFTERFTPPGLVIDFEVDPGDPDGIVASTESRLLRSFDAGRRWRPVASADGIRLSWPTPDALYRAEKDGTVQRSRDGGKQWQPVGNVPGEPYKFKAVGPEKLYLALSDGTIVATQDGGRSWTTTFRP